LKSNRENLMFGPEEAPKNPPLLSVSHAIETHGARLFFGLVKIQLGLITHESTVATSGNARNTIIVVVTQM
jgi:hypothetical protein